MSYLATPENQSSFQQFRLFYKNQLVEKDLPLANQICPKVRIVIKSHRHYLDLQRFKATLNRQLRKTIRSYQMGVLVWLLETETGDLDELQLTNLNHLFWKEVTSRLDFLSKNELYEVDFLRHLYKSRSK